MNSSVLTVFQLPPADPWIINKPLLSSPWPVTFILLGYMLFVLKIGRIFMENRKPFNLKNIILVYNACQVIYNLVIFLSAFYYIFIKLTYNLECIQTLGFDHPHKGVERWLTYAYFINKILDLLDTVFFVLRKSYKQISLLHVYHHIMMVYTMYWVVRFYGVGGQYIMMGLFNSFVHSVMYFYYFISAMYPGLKSSLWWKKYITCIQLTQFVLLFMQSIIVLVFNPSCEFPLFMQFQQLFQSSVMIVMFSNFYFKTYLKPKQQLKQQ